MDDEHVEIGGIVEGDSRTQFADLQNHQISSSENEKSRSSSVDEKNRSSPADENSRSSSEDEKLISSSEDEKLISSSEDEKLISSSEEEKSQGSSEEDEKRKSVEYEKRKRQIDEEEDEERKKQKMYEIHEANEVFPFWAPIDDDEPYEYGNEEEEVDEDENRDDKDSNYPEDVWESTPVKPEECEVELSAEEKSFFIDEDYGCRTSHWATNAELKAIKQALDESEGFDVPFVPWCHYHGTRRTDISTMEDATPVVQCAKCALDFYNKKNGSNFVFDRLVMSTSRPCAGILYGITFKAKSRSPECTKTFQTKAFVQFHGNLHIMMCRIKNEIDQPEQQKAEQCNQVISTS